MNSNFNNSTVYVLVIIIEYHVINKLVSSRCGIIGKININHLILQIYNTVTNTQLQSAAHFSDGLEQAIKAM